MALQRPMEVSLVGFMTIIAGFLHMLTGILVLTGVSVEAAEDNLTPWLVTLAGVFVMLVGAALLGGSEVARALVTVGLVVSLLAAALHIAAHQDANLWPAIVSGVLSLAGLGLLFTGSANRYFGRQQQQQLDRV